MNISKLPPPTVCVPPVLVMIPLPLWATYWDWLTVRFLPAGRVRADPSGPVGSTARLLAVMVSPPALQLKSDGAPLVLSVPTESNPPEKVMFDGPPERKTLSV